MRLLLDTHIFLWYISGSEKLSGRIRDLVRNSNNDVYLSPVSIWEAVVKCRLGRLPIPEPPGSYLIGQRDAHGIISLPLDEGSVARLESLPLLHRDPFDRMLICQSLHHDLLLVSVDDEVLAYPINPV